MHEPFSSVLNEANEKLYLVYKCYIYRSFTTHIELSEHKLKIKLSKSNYLTPFFWSAENKLVEMKLIPLFFFWCAGSWSGEFENHFNFAKLNERYTVTFRTSYMYAKIMNNLILSSSSLIQRDVTSVNTSYQVHGKLIRSNLRFRHGNQLSSTLQNHSAKGNGLPEIEHITC